MSELLVPRSAVFATWLPALRRDPSLLSEALKFLYEDDEPHTVEFHDTHNQVASHTPQLLSEVLKLWSSRVVSAASVFPVPGDHAGIPAQVTGHGIDVGEAILVTLSAPGGDPEIEHWVLVPEITSFGSKWEPGNLVSWIATPTASWHTRVIAAVGTPREAESALRSVLISATETLDALAPASESPAAANLLAGLAGFSKLSDRLPPSMSQGSARLFTESARLRFILDTALSDDGHAINLWQADQRNSALQHIERVSRQALAASTYSGLANT